MLLLALLAPPALATDYRPFWAGLDEAAGWESLGDKQTAELGTVRLRHKVILERDCLEGQGDTSASADALMALAADIPRQPTWSSAAVTAAVTLGGTADSFDYYELLDLPRPLSDRYWFVHANIRREGAKQVFAWEAIDPSVNYSQDLAKVLAKSPGAVMTKVNVGDWTFTTNGATTHIRYRICTDVGGAIPDWAGEYAARSTLPNNLADIVRAALKR